MIPESDKEPMTTRIQSLLHRFDDHINALL